MKMDRALERHASEIHALASQSTNPVIVNRLEGLACDVLKHATELKRLTSLEHEAIEIRRLALLSTNVAVIKRLLDLAEGLVAAEPVKVELLVPKPTTFDLSQFELQAKAAQEYLLKGVTQLDLAGALPGTISVFGDYSFPVVTANSHTIAAAVMSPPRLGSTQQHGRVVAFSHESVWDNKVRSLKPAGFTQFFMNSMSWVANILDDSKVRIAVLGEPITWLEDMLTHIQADESKYITVPWTTTDAQDSIDVVLWRGVIGSGDIIDHTNVGSEWHNLLAALDAGVGLLVAVCPWGFEQVTNKTVKHCCAQNWILRKRGLAFSERMFEGPAIISIQDDETQSVLKHHAGVAVRQLEIAGFPKDVSPELVSSILFAIQSLSGLCDMDILTRWPSLHNLVHIELDSFPFTFGDNVIANTRAAIQLTWVDKKMRENGGTEAAPGADSIWKRLNACGPPDTNSWPTNNVAVLTAPQTISLDPCVGGWQTTGLFALPGCAVSLTIVDDKATQQQFDETTWEVRIGCHADKLWHKTEWSRYPDCSMTWKLEKTFSVCSPFGGPIYFECVSTSRNTSKIEFNCTNSIQAPVFNLGLIEGEWKQRQCHPAPYAELCGDKLIFSVPSSTIRLLSADHLTNVMKFWDSVVASHCELTGASVFVSRLERVVCDVQISYGYMHSGYPVMVHLDQVDGTGASDSPSILNLEALNVKGSWGLFHEFGHNKQLDSYTIATTVEVTVNLFSLYTMWSKFGTAALYHPWLDPAKVLAREHLKADTPTLPTDYGVALMSYAQLIERFGWDTLKLVLKQFLHSTRCVGDHTMVTDENGAFILKKDSTTKIIGFTDTEKMQLWIKRWCTTTKHNVIPFFKKWGWPTEGLDDVVQTDWPEFADAHLGL